MVDLQSTIFGALGYIIRSTTLLLVGGVDPNWEVYSIAGQYRAESLCTYICGTTSHTPLLEVGGTIIVLNGQRTEPNALLNHNEFSCTSYAVSYTHLTLPTKRIV